MWNPPAKLHLATILLLGLLGPGGCAMPVIDDIRGGPGAVAWQLAQELAMPSGTESVWIALHGDTLVVRVRCRAGPAVTRVYNRHEDIWSLGQELSPAEFVEPDGWSWDNVAVDSDTFFSGNLVYVRTNGSWILEQEIRRAVDGAAIMLMGLDQDTIVARPSHHSSGPGAVYLFVRKRGAWAESAKLTYDLPGSEYNRSVAINGDRILVGTEYAGEAHTFVRQGGRWVKESTLVEQGVGLFASSSAFGFAVALSGNTAVIRSNPNHTVRRFFKCSGKLPECDKPLGPNLAHVFERRGGVWLQKAKLGASTLGSDLAIDGESIVFDGLSTSERRGNTWSRLQPLAQGADEQRHGVLARGADEQRYGFIALDGSTLAIARAGGGSVAVFQKQPVR